MVRYIIFELTETKKNIEFLNFFIKIICRLNLTPKSVGYFRLARALTANKEYDGALKHISKAMELAPDDKGVLKEQHAIKTMQKKYNDAEKKKYSKLFG